jgi:hypothetical protein
MGLPADVGEAEGRRHFVTTAMREETERLVKEALERKSITIKQGKTRIERHPNLALSRCNPI